MKSAIAFLIFALSATSAEACPVDLTGTWESDGPTSMAFARDRAKLEPRAETFLAALYGHMRLTFSPGELYVVMPDIQVPVSGKSKPFAGFSEKKPYKILFCNDMTVVFSAKRSFNEEMAATTFNFVSKDQFWVYLGSTDARVPDLNTREYFRRITQ